MTCELLVWQAVFALTQLRLLAIRASGLRKLTAEITTFGDLRRLDLSRNRELDVKDDIPWQQMTALRSLDLSECRHLRVCFADLIIYPWSLSRTALLWHSRKVD